MLRIKIYTKSLHIFGCEEPKQIPIRIRDILKGFCLGQPVKWSVPLHLDSNLQPQVLWLKHGTTSSNRPRSSFCSHSSRGRMQWKIVNVYIPSISIPFSLSKLLAMNAPIVNSSHRDQLRFPWDDFAPSAPGNLGQCLVGLSGSQKNRRRSSSW